MEVQLTRDHEEFIARSVQAGRFSSTDEALREAAELLERRETELQGIRVFVQEGLDDLDAGTYEDFTDENLRDLFDGVESRGRQRLVAGSRP
jgi:putative addiction module CopG family antidote